MKNSIRLLIGLITLSILSCAGDDAQTETTTEETANLDTIEVEHVVKEEIQAPESLSDLIAAFESENKIIDPVYYEQLHVTADDAPLGDFVADSYHRLKDGYVFVFYTSLGASDLYVHYDFILTFFDVAGKFLNQQSISTFDLDVNVNYIQDKFVGIKNRYPEYVEDEEGYAFEATGDTVTDSYYFVSYPIRLARITEIDSSEWPYHRNGLFARHGYIFKNEKYSNYFADFDWYEPIYENVDKLMTPDEKELADYLKSLESK